jgi:hypothetical protein
VITYLGVQTHHYYITTIYIYIYICYICYICWVVSLITASVMSVVQWHILTAHIQILRPNVRYVAPILLSMPSVQALCLLYNVDTHIEGGYYYRECVTTKDPPFQALPSPPPLPTHHVQCVTSNQYTDIYSKNYRREWGRWCGRGWERG